MQILLLRVPLARSYSQKLLFVFFITAFCLLTGGQAWAAQQMQWVDGWRETSPMLEMRSGAAHHAGHGVIHMIGGMNGQRVKDKADGGGQTESSIVFMRTTEYARVKPDGTLSVWNKGPELNIERGFFSAIAHNNYLYAVGGARGSYGKELLNSIERAQIKPDGTLGQWVVEKNTLNISRRCVKLAVIGDYIYAFGGFGGILLDSIERAQIMPDGSLGEWLVASDPMVKARYIHGVERVGESVYIIGGHDKETGGGITDVEWSRQTDDSFFEPWTPKASLQTARYGLASTSHNGFLYAIGGLSGGAYLNSIERAQIKGEGVLSPWQYTTPLPSPREGANTVVLNDNIYLLGGSNQHSYQNSVLYASFNEQGDIGFLATPAEAEKHRAEMAALEASQSVLPHEAVIVEHIKTKLYSYLQVSMVEDQLLVWLAAPAQDFQKGMRIKFPDGAIMENFSSKTLNRTFPFIIFISEARVVSTGD